MTDAIETMRRLTGTGNDVPLTEKEARAILDHIDRLTRERDEAVNAMCESARRAGEAEGKLALSETWGVLEGWIERAKKAERERDEAVARERAATMAWLRRVGLTPIEAGARTQKLS